MVGRFRPGPLAPGARQDVLTEIGREILGSVPDTWTEIFYSVYAIVSYREEEMLVRHGDGEPERTSVPAGAAPRISVLRAGMYQEEKGAWFSTRYTTTRPGNPTTKFDYENEPEFLFLPSEENCVQELRRFTPYRGERTGMARGEGWWRWRELRVGGAQRRCQSPRLLASPPARGVPGAW